MNITFKMIIINISSSIQNHVLMVSAAVYIIIWHRSQKWSLYISFKKKKNPVWFCFQILLSSSSWSKPGSSSMGCKWLSLDFH